MAITFSQTARDVVAGAMRDNGIIGLGEVPDADELDYGIDQLNMMLKELAADGLTPWTLVEATATFPAGTKEVALSPRPVDVSDASFVLPQGYSRVLKRWNDGEYSSLPNKNQSGYPVGYEIRYTTTGVTMRLWPVPNATATIEYTYTRVLEDVQASDPLDIPQMWIGALRNMLSARLSAFGPIGQDVYAKAEIARTKLLDFNRPEQYVMGQYS